MRISYLFATVAFLIHSAGCIAVPSSDGDDDDDDGGESGEGGSFTRGGSGGSSRGGSDRGGTGGSTGSTGGGNATGGTTPGSGGANATGGSFATGGGSAASGGSTTGGSSTGGSDDTGGSSNVGGTGTGGSGTGGSGPNAGGLPCGLFHDGWAYGVATYYEPGEDPIVTGVYGTANFEPDFSYAQNYRIGGISNIYSGMYTLEGDRLDTYDDEGNLAFEYRVTCSDELREMVLTLENDDGSPSIVYGLESLVR